MGLSSLRFSVPCGFGGHTRQRKADGDVPQALLWLKALGKSSNKAVTMRDPSPEKDLGPQELTTEHQPSVHWLMLPVVMARNNFSL